MKIAAGNNRLFREQPFMISKNASQLDERWDEKERVLVQGTLMPIFWRGTRSFW